MKSELGLSLRLCLFNCALSAAFQALGHETLALHPKRGICDLQCLLPEAGFIPDRAF